MPIMQFTINDLNQRFSPDQIGSQRVEDFAEELRLDEVIVERLSVGQEYAGFAAFLATAPDGITKALTGAIRSAISREQPITLAWMPGYDWEMSITDVSDADTPGGMTIVIRSRFPGDPSPVDSSPK